MEAVIGLGCRIEQLRPPGDGGVLVVAGVLVSVDIGMFVEVAVNMLVGVAVGVFVGGIVFRSKPHTSGGVNLDRGNLTAGQ